MKNQKKNTVFIAKSLDGYIAGKNGEIDWLHAIPNPDNIDMGYADLMSEIDAIVMGRVTFETVCNFDIDWPYDKPVFVLSNSMKTIPEAYVGKIQVLKGTPIEILNEIYQQNCFRLYIDGGSTIQNFLREDLVDELRITTIPILLGGGFPLFGELQDTIKLDHLKTEVFLDQVVQSHYSRNVEKSK